jgi:hypothetical protein
MMKQWPAESSLLISRQNGLWTEGEIQHTSTARGRIICTRNWPVSEIAQGPAMPSMVGGNGVYGEKSPEPLIRFSRTGRYHKISYSNTRNGTAWQRF